MAGDGLAFLNVSGWCRHSTIFHLHLTYAVASPVRLVFL